MTVWLAAILTFGLYFGAVPVKFALILRAGSRAGFGAGASLFEGRFALKKARQRASGTRKHLPWRRAELDLRKFRFAAAALRRLLRAARLEQLRLSGRLGLSDAAQTAMAVGFIRALEAALRGVFAPGAVRFDVEPDFSGNGCDLTLRCMLSLSAGQIILGALRGALEAARKFAGEAASEFRSESLFRRVREWTSTPLRIS